MVETHPPKRHPAPSTSQPRLVEQMARTLPPRWAARTEKPVSATATLHPRLFVSDRPFDRADAPPAVQASRRPDWPTRHPARTAPVETGPTVAIAGDDQTRVAQVGFVRAVGHSARGLSSQPADDGHRRCACARLDLSLSGRWPQGLCLSYFQSAHAQLVPNDRD